MNDYFVLSIFPGIDLLGMAFEEEGFCVVRGPDLIWGGDIRNFHPPAGVFGGIIGGPPCGGESNWSYLNKNRASLWPEALRVIQEVRPAWWLLEAVIKHDDAPFVLKLSPRYFGEKQMRRRYFHSNLDLLPFIEVSLFDHPVKEKCVLAIIKRAKGENR